MTTCKTIQPRLTAYLDGELTDERGSVVRGHLRECEACRQIARDEASLRDHLRTLAPVDPPASLWAGVQAQLAAAEVADARAPRWRRVAALWARWTPTLPRLASGGLVAVAAVALLYWRAHRIDERSEAGGRAPAGSTGGEGALPRSIDERSEAGGRAPAGSAGGEGVLPRSIDGSSPPPTLAAVPAPQLAPQDSGHEPQQVSVPHADDVTADLIAEPARTTASYGQAIEDLMKLASEARSGWSDAKTTVYESRVAMLRDEVQRAAPGRPQQRAQRELIRYLQRAVVGEDVLLASGGIR